MRLQPMPRSTVAVRGAGKGGASSICRPRRHGLGLLAALGMVSVLGMLSLPPVCLAGGNLRCTSATDVDLTLTHASGWSAQARVTGGVLTLWNLPAGSYRLELRHGAEVAGDVTIWDGLTTRVTLDPGRGWIAVEEGADDATGAMLELRPETWSALPGDKEHVLAALDTQVRWRPGTDVGDIDAGIAAERREIVPGQREALSAAWLGHSPAGPQAGWNPRNLSLGPGRFGQNAWPRLRAILRRNSSDGTDVAAQLGLSDSRWLGLPMRGWGSARFANLEDAHPRAAGGRVLPHNDAEQLDLTAHYQLGDPTAGILMSGASPRGGPSRGGWALDLDVAARGWQRNHFLEVYRYVEDHAPFEETALFTGRAAVTARLGAASAAEAWVGYRRYLTWIGDGLYRKSLNRYGIESAGGVNGDADSTGLYWSSGRDVMEPFHIFEYFGRKYSATISGGLELRHAAEGGALYGLRAEGDVHTYRRYEHYSPLDTYISDPSVAYGKVLAIGYDRTGAETDGASYDPGRALAGRTSLWLRHAADEKLRVDASLGAHLYYCDDSSLVSIENPLAGGADAGRLEPEDLEATEVQIDPEAYLGARLRLSKDRRIWALGYRRVYMPPLEAAFSPRAYLTDAATKEGVMGNPGLQTEKEIGFEVGAQAPISLAGSRWTLQAAAYGGFMDDVITMEAADLGLEAGQSTNAAGGLVPVYVNGGKMRRYGLHVAAVTGDQRGRWWMRLAYDLGRIESDQFEPPLLDGRWLYPDRPQDEYESEGLAGPLGGIYEAINDPDGLDAGTYRPSNYDRPHRLSVALISRPSPRTRYDDWFTAITSGWTKALMVRLESGRPHTQTGAGPAGLVPMRDDQGRIILTDVPLEDASRNDLRMPTRFTVDVALTREVEVGPRAVRFWIEALNIFGVKNAIAVYRATSEPDADGCRLIAGCEEAVPDPGQGEVYTERIEDPRHYDRAFQLRAGIGIEVF